MFYRNRSHPKESDPCIPVNAFHKFIYSLRLISAGFVIRHQFKFMHKNMHLYSAGKVASFYYTTVAYVFKHMFGKSKRNHKNILWFLCSQISLFFVLKILLFDFKQSKSRGIKACEL